MYYDYIFNNIGDTSYHKIWTGKELVRKYLMSLNNVKQIYPAARKYGMQAVDFVVLFRDGTSATILVKVDKYDSSYMYYEILSNIEQNIHGRFERTNADYIFYYFTESNTLYIFRTASFRKWAKSRMIHCDEQSEETNLIRKDYSHKHKDGNGCYTSRGYLIPLWMIETELIPLNICTKVSSLSDSVPDDESYYYDDCCYDGDEPC